MVVCSMCGTSTSIRNGLLSGVTLRKHDGKYYCERHYPGVLPLHKTNPTISYELINNLRFISMKKRGKKKIMNRYRKVRR